MSNPENIPLHGPGGAPRPDRNEAARPDTAAPATRERTAPPLTPLAALSRRRILRRYWWDDHAWLRALLPNFYKVDDDVYRSNHPGLRALRRARARGVRSVLSLRGDADITPNIIERDAAARLELDLRFIRMRTTILPARKALLELVHQLRVMPKPVLVHCKSGADRTGLAITIYLHVIKGQPIARARRALNWRYAHFSWGRAGIVHRLLDAYAAEHAATGIGFEEWVATRYDRAALGSPDADRDANTSR